MSFMKILCVSNYYFPEHIGGIEVVADNLVAHYRQAGHDVHWIASDVLPTPREVQKGDVPLRAWNFAEVKLGFPFPLPGPDSIPKIWNEVRWCDIVHLHDCLYPANFFVFFFSMLQRKPILLTQHVKILLYKQMYKRWLQNFAYNTIGRTIFRNVNQVVFITPIVHDGMISFLPKKKENRIIANGVDTDFYRPLNIVERRETVQGMSLDPERPLLLFVGRMVEKKGIHLLRPIIDRHPEWNWIFVGRADDINPENWGCSNLVYFDRATGIKLRSLYAIADLLIHPSIGEGVTLVVQEAMACGTPVVLNEESLYGLAEEVKKHIFISSYPATDALEKVIVVTLENRQKLEELRETVRNYAVQKMSWKRVSREYLSLLETLC